MADSSKFKQPRFVTEPDLLDRIRDRCALGTAPKDAARAEGVPYPTWYIWWKRGEADNQGGVDTVYADFYERVQGAFCSFVNQVELKFAEKFLLRDSVKMDWRAYAWFLERARPERWGQLALRGGDELPDKVSGFRDMIMVARDKLGLGGREPEVRLGGEEDS